MLSELYDNSMSERTWHKAVRVISSLLFGILLFVIVLFSCAMLMVKPVIKDVYSDLASLKDDESSQLTDRFYEAVLDRVGDVGLSKEAAAEIFKEDFVKEFVSEIVNKSDGYLPENIKNLYELVSPVFSVFLPTVTAFILILLAMVALLLIVINLRHIPSALNSIGIPAGFAALTCFFAKSLLTEAVGKLASGEGLAEAAAVTILKSVSSLLSLAGTVLLSIWALLLIAVVVVHAVFRRNERRRYNL